MTPTRLLAYFEHRFIAKVFLPVLAAIDKDKKVVVESGTDKDGPRSGGGGGGDDDGGENNAADSEARFRELEREGGGEEHVSSDEEELADDADATETRKKARQADEDYEEGLSDEEQELFEGLAQQIEIEEGVDDPGYGENEAKPMTQQ